MIYVLNNGVIVPGKVAEWGEIFKNELMPIFPEVGLKLVGSWRSNTGDMNAFYNLLVFDDLAALQKSRELQRTVKEYTRASEMVSAIRISLTLTILEPNPWSPMK